MTLYTLLNQGFTLGNPVTTEEAKRMNIPFEHRLYLLSDELYDEWH